jgi:tetratricopeptide (TPR) repeat protein
MQGDIAEDSFEAGAELQKASRFAEAAEVYQRLADKVLTVNLAINLGVCLTEMGDFPRAQHFLRLAAGAKPDNVDIRRLLGAAYAEDGRTDQAEAEYRAGLAAKPGDEAILLAMGGLYLSLGRYAEGWPLLDARIALHPGVVPPISLSFPEWRGEALTGKSILIWVEQGFGDQIQMARFTRELKARGAARVTLGCRPPLAHLFSTLESIDVIIPVAAKARISVDTHDYWSRCFSLPGRLGVTLETLPAAPYLSAPADRRARWRGYGNGARAGLVWQVSTTGFNTRHKLLPDAQAQRLLDRGVISLQPEDTGAADFADTAAIIEGLDLVIAVDTATAHLAGAMGKPCLTMLPYVHCDWRWLRDRSDSPWYPTMKLYRRTDRHDWTGTVDRVLNDLAAAGLGSGDLGAAAGKHALD